MIALGVAIFLATSLWGSIFLGHSLLYNRRRLSTWNQEEWPIQFCNGLSYIYDDCGSDTTILFSHGNGSNLTTRDYIREFCRRYKYNLLLYDYYGYGASGNVPTILMNENYLYSSIRHAYRITRKLSPNNNIVLMGESLGSHPTSWLASKINVGAVVLCVPFDRLKTLIGPGRFIVGDLNNLELCRKFRSPTLVIAAKQDETMPLTCAPCIKDAIKCESKVVWVDSDHCGYLTKDIQKEIAKFITQYSKQR